MNVSEEYGTCQTCARQDRRYCVGCHLIMMTDGTFSRTLWTPKPELTVTFTTQITIPKEITEKGISNAED